MIISSLFNIPIWTKEISNFDDTMKNRLLDLIADCPETRNATQKFYTNRQSDTSKFTSKFSEIISTEIKELKQNLNQFLNNYRIAWLFGAFIGALNNYLGVKYFLFRK